MKKFILYMISIIVISTIGFYGGVFLGEKMLDSKIQKQKIIDLKKLDENIKIEKEVEKNEVIIPKIEKEVVKPKPKPLIPTCPIPKNKYDDMWLSNIDQNNSLIDYTYIPKSLKIIGLTYSTRNDICITNETLTYLKLMLDKAKLDGLTIKVSSGFRSYELQKVIYNNNIKNSGGETSISVAKPGYSEHQLGTTIDLTGASINYSSAVDNFNNTKEDIWLRENAYLYGFVQSYPLGKENTTGYMYEPWHYRYVGIDNAKEIINNGDTIIEFLKK